MKPWEIIAALEATSGRLDKERIVKQAWDTGCVEFFRGAFLAYHPMWTWGVKKVPLIEGDDEPGFVSTFTWAKFAAIMEKLRKRELTGNSARDVLRAAADQCCKAEWNGWYRRIILKDLNAGITSTTVNKILEAAGPVAAEYIAPIFSCQLAMNGEDHPKKMTGVKLLDLKLDGARLLTVLDIESQTVTQYSRNGKENDRFDAITTALRGLLPELKQSIVLDGEVVSRSFQALMKQFNRKDDVDTSDARLALFDMLPLSDFLAGECKLTQTDRHELLSGFVGLLQKHCGDRVYVIPKMVVDLDTAEGQQKFKEFNNEAIVNGFEGVMLKDPRGTYRTRRTDAWLKIKPVYTVDLQVVGFEPGKPESRFRDTLGGLLCRGIDQGKEIEVSVGSGYTEELRKEIWDNQAAVLGRTVEIKGDGLTLSQGATVWSIRFPTFLGFRDDK